MEIFSETNSPFVIGVLGENPFGDDLEQTLHGKLVNAHPCVVKIMAAISEATNCQVLFISASEKKRLSEIFETLRGKSILTVSETDHFTDTGGMINFLVLEKKIRFQINDEAAKVAHLKINSKLLGLAMTASR